MSIVSSVYMYMSSISMLYSSIYMSYVIYAAMCIVTNHMFIVYECIR